jgi:hypothetical protein
MASILPDAFTTFTFVEANGLAAADVEKFEDQAWGDRSTCRAAALHGLSFTLRRIFPGIRHHRGWALGSESKIDSSRAWSRKQSLALAYVMTARILTN